jgi:hypothetical protein
VKRGIFLSIGAVVVIGAVCVASGIAFFQSDNFRGWLSRRVSHSLGADGQFGRLTWTGSSFRSEGFNAVGRAKSKLISLRATNVAAHLRWQDLMLGRIIVDQLTVDRLDMELGKHPVSIAPPTSKPQQFRLPSWNIDFRITGLAVKRLDLHWTRDENVQGTLSGSAATANQDNAGTWTVKMSGGELSQAGFLPVKLVQASGQVTEQSVNIQEATFQNGQEGVIHLQGSVALRAQPSANLHAEFSNVNLNAISPRFVSEEGVAAGVFDYSGNLDRFEQGEVTGHLEVIKFKLDLSSSLGKFRSIVKAGGFAALPFDLVTAKIKYSDHITNVSELHANYGDEVRIDGNGTIRHEDLSADLQVGVAPGMLDSIPGASEKVFLEQREGLRWAAVKVYGTIQQPREDLSKRLVAAIQSSLSRDLKEQAKEAAKSLLDRLLH